MTENDEKRIVASVAKILAIICVRNTKLEGIHAGVVPVSKTGIIPTLLLLTQTDGRFHGRRSRILMTTRCVN